MDEALGVYVPTPRNQVKSADLGELRADAGRLAETLADINGEETVREFSQLRRRAKDAAR